MDAGTLYYIRLRLNISPHFGNPQAPTGRNRPGRVILDGLSVAVWWWFREKRRTVIWTSLDLQSASPKNETARQKLVRAIVTDCFCGTSRELRQARNKRQLSWSILGVGPARSMALRRHPCQRRGIRFCELLEHYKRLDPTMKRFRNILDQWEEEIRCERGEGRIEASTARRQSAYCRRTSAAPESAA
jgi:hypothetical protein